MAWTPLATPERSRRRAVRVASGAARTTISDSIVSVPSRTSTLTSPTTTPSPLQESRAVPGTAPRSSGPTSRLGIAERSTSRSSEGHRSRQPVSQRKRARNRGAGHGSGSVRTVTIQRVSGFKVSRSSPPAATRSGATTGVTPCAGDELMMLPAPSNSTIVTPEISADASNAVPTGSGSDSVGCGASVARMAIDCPIRSPRPGYAFGVPEPLARSSIARSYVARSPGAHGPVNTTRTGADFGSVNDARADPPSSTATSWRSSPPPAQTIPTSYRPGAATGNRAGAFKVTATCGTSEASSTPGAPAGSAYAVPDQPAETPSAVVTSTTIASAANGSAASGASFGSRAGDGVSAPRAAAPTGAASVPCGALASGLPEVDTDAGGAPESASRDASSTAAGSVVARSARKTPPAPRTRPIAKAAATSRRTALTIFPARHAAFTRRVAESDRDLGERLAEPVLERLLEVEDVLEVLETVVGGLLEEVLLDHAEDDRADVARARDPPLGEHRSREQTERLEREVAEPLDQLDAAHVLATLAAPADREVERLEHERVRLLGEPRIAADDLAQHVVAVALHVGPLRLPAARGTILRASLVYGCAE